MSVPSKGKHTAFFSLLVRTFPDVLASGGEGGGAGTYCWEVVSVDAKLSTLSTSASRVRVTLPSLVVSKVK